MKADETQLHECSFCHNTYTLEEGFHLKTMQCAACQKYDDEKPQRDAERAERVKMQQELGKVDFPYVPGDPFW